MSFTPAPFCSRYLFACARRALWAGCIDERECTVRYRVAGDHAHFRAEMAKSAPVIASIAGLVRNMWSLDPDSRLGTSIYLLESEAAARQFLAGPTLEHLLNGPDLSGVGFELTPADQAHPEIGFPPTAPAPESRAASWAPAPHPA